MAEHIRGEVLHVDGQEQWRRIIRRMLERTGYAVISAATFEEAKAILEREGEAFDVAVIEISLVDWDPHNEDGMHLVEYIVDTGQQISVVMLTGYGTVAHCRRAFKDLKVFDFLEKEKLLPDDFTDILAQAVEHKRSLSQQGEETLAL